MSLGLGLGVWRGRMNRAVFTPASLPYLGDWHQAVDDGETLVSAAQPVPDEFDLEDAYDCELGYAP